jgi:single-strand DNA-binding protein
MSSTSLNKVFLMGNLTRDPELRYTPKGTAVADLAIAINRQYKGQDGQDREEVTYVDIVTWSRQAETCAQYLTKGSPIHIEGRLQLDQWEDNEGKKKSRLRVIAERIQFLGRGRASDKPEGQPATAAGAAAPAKPRSATPPPAGPDDGPPIDEDEIPF